MAFAKSFEESFKLGTQTGAASALEMIKEKIKKETETAEKATKLAAIKQSSLDFRKNAIRAGADPKTIATYTEAIAAQKDPDIAEKILTAGMSTMAAMAKDKSDFKQTMQTESYKSGMLGVNEVIKSLAERGGTMIDSEGKEVPITPQSLQDFGLQASDNLKNYLGIKSSSNKTVSETAPEINQNQSAVMEVPPNAKTDTLLRTPIKSKATFKSEEKKASDIATAENTSKEAFRFMQQFDRSYNELKKFDPEITKEGFSGWMSRKVGSAAEYFDSLPETRALKIMILPMANSMAREIEGGRVTNEDRQIYANSFASALLNPDKANTRLLTNSIVGLLDKGGNENGAITKQLKELSKSDADIFKNVTQQILIEYPELVKDIYGEDFEVIE